MNYPIALKYLDTDYMEDNNIPCAGKIIINETQEWDYSVDGNIDSAKKNLCYGFMRAIARILGFGSSIKCIGTGYARDFGRY